MKEKNKEYCLLCETIIEDGDKTYLTVDKLFPVHITCVLNKKLVDKRKKKW